MSAKLTDVLRGKQEKSILPGDIKDVKRKKEKDGIMDEKEKNFSSAFCFVFILRNERLRKGNHKPCR